MKPSVAAAGIWTLPTLLEERTEQGPTTPLFTFVGDEDSEQELMDRATLLRRARAIGADLLQHARPGARAVLIYPPGLEYVAGFFGCLGAGMVAVPAYPPDPLRLERTLPRLQAIIQDAQATVVLTTSFIASMAEALCELAPELRALRWVATDTLLEGAEAGLRGPPPRADSLAFLQYTSGSTGTPKGVELTHANLLHNLGLIHGAFRMRGDSAGVIWLPPYHDMGLIGGILATLYGGFATTLMSPLTFLRRPMRWLEVLSRTHGTISGGPNFAFDLCVRKTTEAERAALDLSHWDVAFCGAEPIRSETLERFAKAFAPSGFRREAFYPCYGLAEGTLIVSGGEVGSLPVQQSLDTRRLREGRAEPAGPGQPHSQTLVGCGHSLQDQEVRVVHPETRVPCASGEVGEVWVKGPSVALGYWGRPEDTARDFQARTSDGAGPFLRTGDQGFLQGQELFITGRIKDLVIVRGRNHHPQDIERTAEQAHAALRPGCGAAFSVEVESEERLVLVYEADTRRQPVAAEEVARAISQQVATVHELRLHALTLIAPGSLPKTSSGKIQRRACRAAYLSGELQEVASWREQQADVPEVPPATRTRDTTGSEALPATPEALEEWLRLRLARRLNVAPPVVARDEPLTRYGLDSLAAVELAYEVEQGLGVVLPLHVVLGGSTLAELAGRLAGARRDSTGPLPRASREQSLPLSFAQQRLWFLDALEPGGALYNIPAAVRLRGVLDTSALERGFAELIRRHESLRTTLHSEHGLASQFIHSEAHVALARVDLGALAPQEREAEVLRRAYDEALRPFELTRGPLLRTTLLRLSDTEHVLVLCMHHIVSDGGSMGVLVREVASLYAAFRQGLPSPLPPLPVQYADHALWQRQWLRGEELERQLSWWKQQLAGAPAHLDLPTDKPRPSVRDHRGASVPVRVPAATWEMLKALAWQEGVTPFMLLLAAFQVLLHRHSGEEDLSVGAPIAGRSRPETQGLIGFFVNTLVLRTRLEGNPSFRELLQRVRETTLGAFAHQEVPFEKLVEQLRPERDLGRGPLFQVMLVLQPDPLPALSLPGLTLDPVELESRTAPFDLKLSLAESAQGLAGSLEYATDLFEPATVVRLVGHLRQLLEGVLARPEQRIAELPLLTEAERHQVLVAWNDTRAPLPADTCIHHLFEAQVARTPEAPALGFEGAWLSYRELEERSNQLAWHLRSLGVGPEVRVGLCAERSLELVVGLLAILKAGGAYVPLDPSYPRQRLEWMLEDARPAVLLAQPALMAHLPEAPGSSVVSLALGDASLRALPTHPPAALATADNLAYVIFTSGSTGRPKGAMNAHRAVCNRLLWLQQVDGLGPDDVVLQKTPYGFDISVWEFFWPLIVGARLVVARPGGHQEPDYLLRLIREQHITTTHFVPSMLHPFLEQPGLERCSSLRRVVSSGEALSPELAGRCLRRLPSAQLYNLYGPTETAIEVTSFHCRPQHGHRSIPIGRPISNALMRILDAHLRPVPTGVPGELFIGGIPVGRGYISRPVLTAERFVPDPFSSEPGARLYRTGDKARWLADGDIEYLGRLDFQVKVRGQRIELGEIEAALEQHPQVRQAVVVVQEGASGDKRLVAYGVPPSGGQPPSAPEVRDFLKSRLPESMLPSAFVPLEALPLTASGKVNRKALPPPDLSRTEPRSAYVAPRGDVEQRLCDSWAQVLGLKQVGIHDNFFELGGDSIISLQVVARARQAGLAFSTRQLFQHQTVAQLARVVESASQALGEQGPVTGPVPLTPVQLQLLAHDAVHVHHFNQAVLLASREPLESARLEKALARVVAHHDALRLRLRRHEGEWLQDNASPDEASVHLLQVDLSSMPASEQPAALEAEASRMQASFVLAQPPLLRAALFLLGNGQQRLLLVANHLVVDAVSWRVILEDLESDYLQAVLPPKSTSFQSWARRLRAHADSQALLAEAPLWLDAARAQVAPLPTDASGPNTHASERSVSIRLNAEETKLLLQEVPTAWRAHINDVLLSALARALGEWTGQSHVLVHLEGHGREELFDDVDLSRTVGWFTSFIPVLLPVRASDSVGEGLRGVRDGLRRLPHHGLGFGLLKWLGPADIARRLRALPAPQVAFNYLGQFDGTVAASRLFSMSPEPSGPSAAPSGPRLHALEINGSVLDGQLQFSFGYSAHLHHAATIESLARRFVHHLRDLISLRASEDARRFSPGDFPLAGLSPQSLEPLLRRTGPDIEDLYPLSATQQGMLFHAQLAPSGGHYFEQLTWAIRPLDVPALKQAWDAVVASEAVFRTRFVWEGLEQPLQVVSPKGELPWRELDWRNVPAAEQPARLESFLREDQERGFDLGRAPLARLTIIRMAEEDWHCVWSFHHLLLDGWSVGVLLRRLLGSYEAAARGQVLRLEPAPAFRDYIAWLGQKDTASSEQWWRKALAGFTAPTPLPGAKPVPAGAAVAEGGERVLKLPASATASLQSFARRHELTVSTLAQAAWALVLSRYSGEEDVLFGVTVSGRPPELPGVEEMVGLFIHSLPARVQVESGTEVVPWLQKLQAQQVELRQHEHCPLVQLQSWSDVPRGTPLFESLFVFENYPLDAALTERASGVSITDVRMRERPHYPLVLAVVPGTELRLQLAFDTARHDEATAARLLEHVRLALEGLASGEARRPRDISFLQEQERQQVLVAWNDTRAPYPRDTPLHVLFSRQAERTPDATALVLGDEHLTYRQLDSLSNQLACHLRSLGVRHGSPVALCLERSFELIVSLLAILKAGGAYVPFDASEPRERLALMLQDVGAHLLLTQPRFADSLSPLFSSCFVLGPDWRARLASWQDSSLDVPGLGGDSLAYVMFTSGTTGRPKGVCIPHRAVARLVLGTSFMRFGPQEVFLQLAPVAFDASTLELWGSLLHGARLVLPPPHALSLEEVAGLLRRHGVSALFLTTALFAQMVQHHGEALGGVPQVLAGGEAMPMARAREHLLRMRPGTRFLHVYGPTENTTFSTSQPLAPATAVGASLPIGGPISNSTAYVLDPALHPVPVGMPGELYVGGEGLAWGYLHRADLTAERFIPNPFSTEPGARLYRTGDKVRWLADGTLDFLGRTDFQVKLRGFRIEPGEVEAALRQLPGVRDAIVRVHEDVPGDKRLVAYVVPGTPLTAAGLRAALPEHLPEYMVPTAFVLLESLPLNANGKVDRKALPAPDASAVARAPSRPPSTDTERQLAALWADVLKLDTVGAEDDFFALGGHSLLATQVISRVRATFGMELPLSELFAAPTVAALAERVEALRQRGAPSAPPLVPVPRTWPLPLSFAQQRLWFLDQLQPGSAFYNVPGVVWLEGELDLRAFEQGLTALVDRHEVLRTTFPRHGDVPVQVIHPTVPPPLPLIDLTHLAPEEREREARRLALEEAQRPFDLTNGPVVRVRLLRLERTRHALLVTLHHIVSDGWSVGVMVRELAALYRAFISGQPAPLPPLPVQYADFAAWQRQWLQGEVLQSQLDFWRQQLADMPAALELPTDRPRPAIQSFRGASLPVSLPRPLSDSVQALAWQEGATPFMVLLASFQLLLSRDSGQDDIVVGSPIANRNRAETEGLIGFFVNSLVLRARIDARASFRALLRQVKQSTLAAYEHQDVPFEKLVEQLQPGRDQSRSPLFQVIFALQNTPMGAMELSGLRLRLQELAAATAKFDLDYSLTETAEGLTGTIGYSTDLFDAATISRMMEHHRVLLESLCAEPDAPLDTLSHLTRAERQQVLVAWNDTRTPYPRDTPLHVLFSRQAELTPDATALVLGDEHLTYRQLDSFSNQLARHLRSLGVRHGSPVALCLERSFELIVSLLAILKAGGAYVPFDASEPRERLALMLQDVGAHLLLTQPRFADSLSPLFSSCFVLGPDWRARLASSPDSSLDVPGLGGDSLAYVMFTSGTTGRPKAVAIEHRSVLRLFHGIHYAHLGPEETFLLIAPISFDASTLEVWGPLLFGGTLVVFPPESPGDLKLLAHVLRHHGITTLHLTAGLFAQMVDLEFDSLRGLRQLLTGGDVVSAPHVRRAIEELGIPVTACYGPTESTLFTSCHRMTRPEQVGTSVPIGHPIANTRVYLLDARLQPVPVGVPGELFIGGDGLARGYLSRPELTAERFIPDALASRPGERLYRTGDLARWRPDGGLDFLGRLDNQVKVRGFRIELAEVEASLRAHPALREAVAVVREDVPGDKRLVAYGVPAPDQPAPEADALRAFLAQRLPGFMVPSAFVALESLPLTPNGKVDRKALPVPQALRSEEGFVAPRTPLEQELAAIWAEVLGLDKVGIHDNFFSLGGHSLLATQAISRLRARFGEELPLQALFEDPTVAKMGQRIEQRAAPKPQTDEPARTEQEWVEELL
ncbi:non-ribosomal peptide synthase/polyketide synthase [Corallococcus exiguus]|uniref:non-ribosomal peptide synthase/polyketide synthase n=1 Tax=Corallococcus exiguus TaxID=83462 RepID=UPI0014727528|nr:non-ribosomal peptide synthase/polyketide synthase [Corallococcus exiguus]NNB93012.1 non-ribosomal peptide synthase/polyketide synthase [Corallococcus exiguus]